MKSYNIEMTDSALNDLEDIISYITDNSSHDHANQVLNNIESLCEKLSHFPERGHFFPELNKIGITEFREIHFKPYRIIYEIQKSTVYIVSILDGRRNLDLIFRKRLLNV